MLGIVYILLCFLVGYGIVNIVFPGINRFTEETYSGSKLQLSSLFFKLPAYYVTGTLAVTWPVYILANCFNNSRNPLGIANIIVMSVSAAFGLFMLYIIRKRKEKHLRDELKKISVSEKIALFLVCVIITVLMFRTLYSSEGCLCVGLSVFSDFSTHLSMIRSFSHGSNFPTQYSFFAGQDVKYHFMFQFLTGNLEYLGLRIDLAFNISSILSLLGAYMMLYVLAVKISGRKAVGLITWVLFTFRSSWALYEFIKELPKDGVLKGLAENVEFIGATEHENWGLWNLNVYCNQRHFAFSLTVMLFVILLMLPCIYAAGRRLWAAVESVKRNSDEKLKTKNGYFYNFKLGIKAYFCDSLFSIEGWAVKDMRTAIFAGIILGAIGFWNGAVLIGTVIVLFFMAAGSDRRFEFVILAGIAGSLSLLQSKVFISGSLFEPQYYYGFLSEPKTFINSVDFVWKMMGILPLFLLFAFAFEKGTEKYIMICFSMPIIFSFTVSLTPDISVNHKYIMMAIMLLDVFAAKLLYDMFSYRNAVLRILAAGLLVCLTLTGIYEFEIVMKKNIDNTSMKYRYDDPLMDWIWENTDSTDLFLTGNYYLTYGGTGNSMILSGTMLFNGWEYFSWSAGYNSAERDAIVADIYSCDDIEKLYKLVDKEKFSYIVVDFRNREAEDYVLNEDIFEEAYEKVYSSGSDEYRIAIYDVNQKKVK